MRCFICLIQYVLAILMTSHAINADNIAVYFGTLKDGGIHYANFNSQTGKLSQPRQVAALDNAGFITIHPSGQYLYSTGAGQKELGHSSAFAFRIEDDHSLSRINSRSSEGMGACHISLDQSGETLLVANYGSNQSVAALKVNEDGSLNPSTSNHLHQGSGQHPHRQKSPHPHSIITNPSNTFAYAADLGIDQVVIYALDAQTATLTPASSAKVPGGSKGPRHMKFSEDGRFAYVLNELSQEVVLYETNTQTGALTYIDTASSLRDRTDLKGMTSSEIRIHPTGKYLYNANRDTKGRGRDSLSVFSIAPSNGHLELIQVIPAGVSVPRNFNIDPSGQWLLVGGQKSNNIATFKIDLNSGTLSQTEALTLFDGSPTCIEFLLD
ncbi:MAG: lactonase family protein [Opitutales bacterium]|jgi:6-phosphogluconolactonase|nr:lactonase family protein [Opitutales bacterium]MDP4644072.1 lactonase family protein [Opitutales bacterium]MDP4777597.1 lactonase family protein [Opitutales bacterium]MDP4882606.1 lactonase family protein [Opitutales bacterium]MDP5079172.1 lactonase family protein [Opitutales bacterium]